jgi:hypothetical protein
MKIRGEHPQQPAADSKRANGRLKPDENLTCDECGRYGAIDFGVRKLCPDCYENSGSCCPAE